jgi:hypothetical protein
LRSNDFRVRTQVVFHVKRSFLFAQKPKMHVSRETVLPGSKKTMFHVERHFRVNPSFKCRRADILTIVRPAGRVQLSTRRHFAHSSARPHLFKCRHVDICLPSPACPRPFHGPQQHSNAHAPRPIPSQKRSNALSRPLLSRRPVSPTETRVPDVLDTASSGC